MGNFFTKLLAAPIANPFRIHTKTTRDHTRDGTVKTVGKGYHLHWQKRDLPGAGAGQYAYESLGLPPYAVFGFGNINVQNPLRETFPASYVFQSVGIVGNPPSSIVQGQIITQPLMDPSFAQNIGIITPGAVNAGPNAIVNNAPILSG
jgi:hypothetical protein